MQGISADNALSLNARIRLLHGYVSCPLLWSDSLQAPSADNNLRTLPQHSGIFSFFLMVRCHWMQGLCSRYVVNACIDTFMMVRFHRMQGLSDDVLCHWMYRYVSDGMFLPNARTLWWRYVVTVCTNTFLTVRFYQRQGLSDEGMLSLNAWTFCSRYVVTEYLEFLLTVRCY